MDQITSERFIKETGMSNETFQQAVRLRILPVLENGMIDFSGGWNGIARFAETARGDEGYASRISTIHEEVEKRISSLHESRSTLGRSSPIVEDSGEFFSDAGRKAFTKAAARGQVRIQGKAVNSQLSPEWWKAEGFLSEEAAVAFKEAMARGCVRIFSR